MLTKRKAGSGDEIVAKPYSCIKTIKHIFFSHEKKIEIPIGKLIAKFLKNSVYNISSLLAEVSHDKAKMRETSANREELIRGPLEEFAFSRSE